jgi:hypothetical protein
MNHRMYHIICLALVLLFVSCEDKTDWDLNEKGRITVADCIITNELKQQELRLYESSGTLNGTVTGISGATVTISDGVNEHLFTEDPDEPGHYLSQNPFRATLDITYRLVISYANRSDTAFAQMAAITPMEALDIQASDSLFRVFYHESPSASMMEIYYDWSQDTEYTASYGSATASETFYTLNDIEAGNIFAPDRQVIRFPHHTNIIRRKYSLSKTHQDFIRGLLLETDWRGGLFDAEPGNVPTNFHNGLHGWFGACMVLSDSTQF